VADQPAARAEHRVAVVGSDPELQELLCDVLDMAGYRPSAVPRDAESLEAVAQAHPELIVLDLGMTDAGSSSGWTFLRALRRHRTLGMVPVLVCSADVSALRERAEQLSRDSLVATLEKPFALADLERAVAALLDGTPLPGWDDRTDLVLVADAEANIIDASGAALALLGLSADEIRHRRVSDVVADGDPWTREQWLRYREEGRWNGGVTLKASDGREIQAQADAQIVTIDDRAWHVSRLSLPAEGQPASR
jgi:PAS domain S-box-containing protein